MVLLATVQMETLVYISEFLSPNLNALPCIIKARYSDFHVTEILPNGTLVEITSPLPSEVEEPQLTDVEDITISSDTDFVSQADPANILPSNEFLDEPTASVEDDEASLSNDDWMLEEPWKSLFHVVVDPEHDEKMHSFIMTLHSLLLTGNPKTVESCPIPQKEKRTLIHQCLKHDSILASGFVLSSSTIPETNTITVVRRRILAKKNQPQSRGSDAFFDCPKFIQFYLYKQNRSTMEAVGKMAHLLR